MTIFVLAFLLGDLYLQIFSDLPGFYIVCVITIMCFLVWMFLHKRIYYSYLPFAFFLGFLWSLYFAHSILSWTLPKAMEGKALIVTGYITSLPTTNQFNTSFEFNIKELKNGNESEYLNTLARLSWWHKKNSLPIHLKVGEKWQFAVKLKRIHGMRSPGAFDFEAWALQKGIRVSGYVVENRNNILLSSHPYRYPLNYLRQLLQIKIAAHLPHSNTSQWLMALTIGERSGISQQYWQVLRNTGTNHLMAIAGLHIGIMAGLAHYIVAWCWRRIPLLVLRVPAVHAGACAALFVALIYSALVGFSLPTQRACIMLTIFILSILAKRQIMAWTAWSFALLGVILLNPLSVLTESFWLSFVTIALIIYGMSHRLLPSGIWWKWGRVQWVIGFGLIPVTLILFQECSFISFLANSIAIPWLGFLILPFCFLSMVFIFVSPTMGAFCLYIADKSLNGLWLVLTWLAALPYASWQIVIPNVLIFFLTLIGFLLLLIPIGVPGRWNGLIWLLPLLTYQSIRPVEGNFWLTVLDVGQGLATVVQTKNHLLVYDTGPNFNNHFNMGESIVLPYLRTIAVKKIDRLIISHGDNDHIGGAGAIMHALPITDIITSVPNLFHTSNVHYCLAGDSWEWDGVKFTFLYPTLNDLNLGNDSSCVLRIDNGDQSVLLTGDIEKSAENNLLARISKQLQADMMIAPHHGSKTSDVEEFIAAVQPKIILYATGYRNRYHFPHQSVMEKYEKIHAISFNTTSSGTVHFKMSESEAIFNPDQYRITHKKYWHEAE